MHKSLHILWHKDVSLGFWKIGFKPKNMADFYSKGK